LRLLHLSGRFLAISFLLPEREGSIEKGSLALRKKLRIFGFIWLATSAFQIVLTLANILGTSVLNAFDMIIT